MTHHSRNKHTIFIKICEGVKKVQIPEFVASTAGKAKDLQKSLDRVELL